MQVLDLDLDYFNKKFATGIPDSVHERLPEKEYGESVWCEEKVRIFLEHNLGLSKSKKIKGRIVKNHNESLFFWEDLIAKGKLSDPFEVIHIDSHADLGLGYNSPYFLQSDFLTLPKEMRRTIRSTDQDTPIGIGDYLLWGIAYKLISKIIYCANPNGDKNDYCWETLKNFHEENSLTQKVINYIQLKYNPNMEIPRFNADDEEKIKYLNGAMTDQEVELIIIPTEEEVNFSGDFDYAILAQSPSYTPASADYIIKIFREYIEEI